MSPTFPLSLCWIMFEGIRHTEFKMKTQVTLQKIAMHQDIN